MIYSPHLNLYIMIMPENSPVSVPPVSTPSSISSVSTEQIVWTANQVRWLVVENLANFSQNIGTDEIIAEASDWLMPMKDFVFHVLKIAFFINPVQRVTRGEYIIGSLSVTTLVGLFSGLLAAFFGSLGILLWFLSMTVPLINLATKRFHDLNKPGRWSVMLLIPFLGLIMPVLFKWVNENNLYWPDPITTVPQDDKWYIITILTLFIISSLITSLLSLIGISSTKPKIDPDPTTMGQNNIVWTQKNNLWQKL